MKGAHEMYIKGACFALCSSFLKLHSNYFVHNCSTLIHAAMKVLCPENKPKSPIAVEIVRNIFAFLVRNRLFNEALEFSASAVAVCLASQLEGAAFKILASVTVIQLAQGDAVKVFKHLSSYFLLLSFQI